MHFTYIVVGGGIAGVSCAEILAQLDNRNTILLISESCLIKSTINLIPLTKMITKFDIKQIALKEFEQNHTNITVIHDSLLYLNSQEKYILTSNKQNTKISYDFLCLCTGARPKYLPILHEIRNEFVITIRDTDSVENFLKRISHCKRIVVIGNGGIASEIVFKCENIHIDWIIKDDHISATFLDPGSSEFFIKSVFSNQKYDKKVTPVFKKNAVYEEDIEVIKKHGAALGPNWYKNLEIFGSSDSKNIEIHYNSIVENVKTVKNYLELYLNDGLVLQTDLIVLAIGVEATINFQCDNNLSLTENGILVNEQMETNLKDIFAAGDVCYPNWCWAQHWFPMKLWTQAKQMGAYAAKCMYYAKIGKREENVQDFCFELFTHSTTLFGFEVILLGLYNGQKLDKNYECLIRMTNNKEFIKLILSNQKLQGAILVGNTELAETFENLVLNQLDLSSFGDDLLNPNIDIDDYFD